MNEEWMERTGFEGAWLGGEPAERCPECDELADDCACDDEEVRS